MLAVFAGIPLALGVFGGSAGVYYLTNLLAARARRTGSPRGSIAIGWTIIHLAYVPCFYVRLPFIPDMVYGELTLFFGIGMLVLKSAHYLWERCRGGLEDDGLRRFLLYMTFLPTFRLGPLDFYAHFNEEVDTHKSRINRRNFGRGLLRIALGGARLAVVVYWIIPTFFPSPRNIPFDAAFFEMADDMSVGWTWLTAYMVTLQVYLAFSAYSDGAIGLALMMGIRLPENFRSPLLATSISELWRRWHVSMGQWLRTYIYLPLGGNRRRMIFTILPLFIYCGLWHYPSYAGPWFFAALHTAAIAWSRWWKRFCRRHQERNDTVYRVLQGAGLIDGVTGRVLGWFWTFHALVFTGLFLLDHEYSGVRVIARMFGLNGG